MTVLPGVFHMWWCSRKSRVLPNLPAYDDYSGYDYERWAINSMEMLIGAGHLRRYYPCSLSCSRLSGYLLSYLFLLSSSSIKAVARALVFDFEEQCD